MRSLENRLGALERARHDATHPARVIRLVGRDADETEGAAVARWCGENPGLPAPSPEDVIFLCSLLPLPVRAP